MKVRGFKKDSDTDNTCELNLLKQLSIGLFRYVVSNSES